MVAKAQYPQGLDSEFPYSFVDGEIPALRIVLNPNELGQHLSRVLPTEWGSVRDIKLQVLQRHRRRRWTVHIALETTTGKHELIGKVHATDRADVYRAMKQIHQAGFGSETEFSIPEPIAYIPALNLLLQEKVEGPLATDIFSAGSDAQRAKAAERCALWLAHFHSHAPLAGPVFELTGERMEDWARRLVNPFKPLENKARLLSQEIEQASSALGASEMVACHGGFWHQQLILNQDRVVAVDWDNHCIADPSRDVAKFIIELQQLALRLHGSIRALDAVIAVFYRTYTAGSRFPVARSLPLYEAAVCLKRAKYHLRRNGGGPEQAEGMLEEGLRVLAERV